MCAGRDTEITGNFFSFIYRKEILTFESFFSFCMRHRKHGRCMYVVSISFLQRRRRRRRENGYYTRLANIL